MYQQDWKLPSVYDRAQGNIKNTNMATTIHLNFQAKFLFRACAYVAERARRRPGKHDEITN